MSTAEILNELANLTPAERAEIPRRIAAMDAATIDLQSRGIDARAAAELRGRLEPFEYLTELQRHASAVAVAPGE